MKKINGEVPIDMKLAECQMIVGSAECDDAKFLASLRTARDLHGVLILSHYLSVDANHLDRYLVSAEPHTVAWLRQKAQQAWYRTPPRA
jgi:hypothetical protein